MGDYMQQLIQQQLNDQLHQQTTMEFTAQQLRDTTGNNGLHNTLTTPNTGSSSASFMSMFDETNKAIDAVGSRVTTTTVTKGPTDNSTSPTRVTVPVASSWDELRDRLHAQS